MARRGSAGLVAVVLCACVAGGPVVEAEAEGAAATRRAPAPTDLPDVAAPPDLPDGAASPAVPPGWVDVPVGAAVLSIPPGWRTLRDDDDGWYQFGCGERTVPTLRVMEESVATGCPDRSLETPAPRAPAVLAVTVDEVHAGHWTSLVLEGSPARIGPVHGYEAPVAPAPGRGTSAGGTALLLPDLGLYLLAEPGDDDASVAAAVLRSVRPREDASPSRRPFLGLDGRRVWWLEGPARRLVWEPPDGHQVVHWRVAPGFTRESWTIGVRVAVEPPDYERPNLHPQQLVVVRVEDGSPEVVWSTTVRPVLGQLVDGLVVGGGPVWSPDGRYLAYADADVAERRAVVHVAGWLGPGVDGAPDVSAEVTDLELPGPVRPFLRGLAGWEEVADGRGYLVIEPGATGDGTAHLPVVVDAEGRVEFPGSTLQPSG